METTPDWSDKTILVVEDEEVNRFFYKSVLKTTNAKILFANDGDEGVKIALSGTHIDCVLMDIRLPKMNGFEAIKNIKKNNKKLPIIVQTAYALTNERVLAYDSGCDDYITKPIRINILFNVLKKYLS
jgi:CheY-like chemotaxis protein